MADPLEAMLRRSPLTNSQRADIWDAYHSAGDQDALAAALKPLKIPNEVKAGLWDMKATTAKAPVHFPGENSAFTNAPPETLGDQAKKLAYRSATGGAFDNWQDASDYFFGSKERNEAKAAGLGVDPTPSEMVQGALFVAGPALGEIPIAAEAPSLIRAGAVALRANPKTAGAAMAAAPDLLKGDLKGAAINAALAAAGIGGAQKLPMAFKMAGLMKNGASVEEALAAILAEGKAAAPRVHRAPLETPPAVAPEALPAPVQEPVPAPRGVPASAPVTDPGKVAAAAHNRTMAFAKEAAQTNPKIGQKIWMELDETGAPVRVLTPDQAASAKRQGLPTTWVKNLWPASAR